MDIRLMFVILVLISPLNTIAFPIANNKSAERAGNQTFSISSKDEGRFDNSTRVQSSKVKIKHIPYANQKHCALIADNDTVLSEKISRVLKEEATLVEFKVKFRGEEVLPRTVIGKEDSLMFKPDFWVRTTGRFGTRLLLLKPNYEIMSFKSLELEVKKFKHINLNEYPDNCMDNLTYDDVEIILRELVMNNFQNTSVDLFKSYPTDQVCNMHIRDIDGAHFTYYCCRRNIDLSMTCEYLQADVWLELMQTAIGFIKVFFILYCPLLIPKSIFHQISSEDCFNYVLQKKRQLAISLKRATNQREKDSRISDSTICLNLSKIKHMQKFKAKVQDLPINGEVKLFDIFTAELQSETERLLNPGEAPASLFKLLYEFIINCRMREMASVRACCNAPIGCRKLTWHQLARMFMKILFGVVLLTPWIIRIIVYYVYEHKEISLRKKEALEKGHGFPFQGNFTWSLTPIHGLFICIYIFLLVESVFIGSLSKMTQEEFRFLFRKCYNDMRTDSRTAACGVFVRILLLPFSSCGWLAIFFGFFFWIPILPLALVYFVFHVVPTINLTIRMLFHFIVYAFPKRKSVSKDKGWEETPGIISNLRQLIGGISVVEHPKSKGTLHGRLVQLVVIIFCIITTYSTIFLLFELATFFLDVFIYTTIGFILYADYTLTYISLGVLLIVYGKDCFGGVSRCYRQYSSTLNKFIMTLCYHDALGDFYEDSETQKNKAFAVNPCGNPNDEDNSKKPSPGVAKMTVNRDTGTLIWTVRKITFFLTDDAKPKIPTKLFFEACEMTYANVPGRPLHRYLRALLHFLFIVAFLLFVFLVVMAFGESGTLSASNQLLATIAGGILPFLLKNFIFKPNDEESIDPDKDINFRVAIHNLIHGYSQNWPVYDIEAVDTMDCKADIDQDQQTMEMSSVINDHAATNDPGVPSTSDDDDSGTNGDVIKMIIEFDDKEVDMYDFHVLYNRLYPIKEQRIETANVPLRDETEVV